MQRREKNLILLTGATGFVGSQVLKILRILGHRVRVVVRKKSSARLIENYHRGDLIFTDNLFQESEQLLREICTGVEAIVHAAWYVEPGQYLVSEKNHECQTGTIRLAEAAIASGVSRFVGLGTCLEYEITDNPLSVFTPLKPMNEYAKAKHEVYKWLSSRQSSGEIDVVWCRLFYLYGEGEDERRLIPYLHSCLRAGVPAKLTSGRQIRDYLDVKDAASLIAGLAVGDKTGAYNICSGIPLSVRQLAERVADVYGRRDLLEFCSRDENILDPPYVVGVKNC